MACGSDSTPAATTSPTESPGSTNSTVNSGDTLSLTAELVELLRPSVVHIKSEAATLDVFGQLVPSSGVGTGFIIDDEGHIVTNNHVISINNGEPADDITVTLDDGSQHTAEIVGRDPPTDIAVLKIDAQNLKAAALGDSSSLKVGEDVIAIGNALDLRGRADGHERRGQRSRPADTRGRSIDSGRDPDGRGDQPREFGWSAGKHERETWWESRRR